MPPLLTIATTLLLTAAQPSIHIGPVSGHCGTTSAQQLTQHFVASNIPVTTNASGADLRISENCSYAYRYGNNAARFGSLSWARSSILAEATLQLELATADGHIIAVVSSSGEGSSRGNRVSLGGIGANTSSPTVQEAIGEAVNGAIATAAADLTESWDEIQEAIASVG